MAYTTIDDPSAHFQIALWTGNGSSGTAVTNDGNSNLQPDLLWGKIRDDNADQNRNHWLIDSTRGINKAVGANTTSSEETNSGYLNSFDSDGFTLGNDGNSNDSGDLVVGWQWKANGGTTTDGSSSDSVSTSNYQANTTAGFSIVTYTGNGTAGATVAHGLGAIPNWIIVKDRDASKNWVNYHQSLGNDRSITLNTSDAQSASTDHWHNNTPTSSVFYLGDYSHVNRNSDKFVAYCWAPIQGYSKFGKYTGNGNADGPFIYTGFKPAWVLIKRSDGGSENWNLNDNKRSPVNPTKIKLSPNTNGEEAEDTGYSIDFLSNGFKIRHDGGDHNSSGATYIYMTFAEHPFVSSKGAPVTAR